MCILDQTGRVERFIARLGSVVPEDTYVIYSPEYSHPTLEAFRSFAVRLSRHLDQPLEWLGKGLAEGHLTPTSVRSVPPGDPLMRLVLFLRRRGIY